MSDDAIAALEELREQFVECASQSFEESCEAETDRSEAYHDGQRDAYKSAEAFVHDALEAIEE